MPDTIVVGIGNPYRGDDAAGWAVIDGLEKSVGPVIGLTRQQGDIAELIDIFTHHKNVYLIDACQSCNAMGAWRRIDVHRESIKEENPQTSTHGFSVSQAISLAKNLNLLPNKLILYVINGGKYSISHALSPSVANGVEDVIKAILNEKDIQSCMNIA